MPVHVLSPQSMLLPNITVAFSLLATGAGTAALLYPEESIKTFGLRPVAGPEQQRLSEALIQVYGIRNACTGLTNLAVWWSGRNTTGAVRVAWRQILGLMFVMNIGVPLIDGVVAQRQGHSNPWMHWTFVPITLSLGSALLATSESFI